MNSGPEVAGRVLFGRLVTDLPGDAMTREAIAEQTKDAKGKHTTREAEVTLTAADLADLEPDGEGPVGGQAPVEEMRK